MMLTSSPACEPAPSGAGPWPAAASQAAPRSKIDTLQASRQDLLSPDCSRYTDEFAEILHHREPDDRNSHPAKTIDPSVPTEGSLVWRLRLSMNRAVSRR